MIADFERAHTPAQSGWTPATIEKVWRIFDKAVPIIAEGCGVNSDQLRAYLVEGIEPPIVDPDQVAEPEALSECEDDQNDQSYVESDNAVLAMCKTSDRFRLRDKHGEFLHMAVLQNLRTTDKVYAWRGTRSQLRAIRAKYPFTRPMGIVVEPGL